ncbi:ABC transporter permease [Arcanobacterium pinnipediorum]|uniref:Iron ABC transporter permease n=1 Tax=Arcanobacterium pinnipediorum TaxID=1503041 RepID=A0ABY5AHZ2_9ACTO|nr:iron ABC transporter permease [Arcanobacterium pinnipediorum]USR79543.1 iron ABC transporter permease [Arcanobacterium pinnipediorum]
MLKSLTQRPLIVWALCALGPALFLGLFFFAPVIDLLSLGVAELAASWNSGGLAGIGEQLSRARAGTALVTTLALAFAGTLLSIAVGVPAAYILYRRRFPGQNIIRFLIVFPFVLPTIAVATAFRSLYDDGGLFGFLNLAGSPILIVLAMMFFNISVIVRTVGAAWGGLNPNYEAAARTLGASPLRAFTSVTWPRLAPAVYSAATLVFLYCSTSYSLVMILGTTRTRTLETEIYRQTAQFLNLGTAAVLSLVQAIIVVAALIISQRFSKDAVVVDTHSRFVRSLPRVTRQQRPMVIGVLAIVLALIVLPIVQVIIRSLRRNGEFTIANFTDLFRAGAARSVDFAIASTIWQSLSSAIYASVIAVVVGGMVGLLVTRKMRTHQRAWHRVQSLYDALFIVPVGISSVTLGFGMLVAMGSSLRFVADSPLLLPLAQALVALPILIRTIVPMLDGVNRDLYDAAVTLGASRFRAFFTVEGPVLARALGVGAGFAFAISIGEFSATSFLVLQREPTLPVMIYQLVSRAGAADQGMAYAGTVILCAITALVMVVVEVLSKPRSSSQRPNKEKT